MAYQSRRRVGAPVGIPRTLEKFSNIFQKINRRLQFYANFFDFLITFTDIIQVFENVSKFALIVRQNRCHNYRKIKAYAVVGDRVEAAGVDPLKLAKFSKTLTKNQ